MSKEDIEEIVQTILTEKLQDINNRLNKIDDFIDIFKKELIVIKDGVENKIKEGQNDDFPFTFYIQPLYNEVQDLKQELNKVKIKQDKKLVEIENVKQLNQELSIKSLSRLLAIHEEFRVNQKSLQNIVQTGQKGQAEEFNENTHMVNVQNKNQFIQQKEGEVFKTLTGKKYHEEGCKWLSKSKIPVSLKQAVKEGLQPCLICIQ